MHEVKLLSGIRFVRWAAHRVTEVHLHNLLMYHDLLGIVQHPHHGNVIPRFCKLFASEMMQHPNDA